MKNFVVIVDGEVATNIGFEEGHSDYVDKMIAIFSSNPIFVQQEKVPEGWVYDAATNNFYEP